MSQRRNRHGVQVTWLDGQVTEHWFRTPAIADFMRGAFERLRHHGWDDGDGVAQVESVVPIKLEIIARV